jgi:hypothetical protein
MRDYGLTPLISAKEAGILADCLIGDFTNRHWGAIVQDIEKAITNGEYSVVIDIEEALEENTRALLKHYGYGIQHMRSYTKRDAEVDVCNGYILENRNFVRLKIIWSINKRGSNKK